MFEIPEDRLPPGFAATVDEPPASPVDPYPAATVVLMRDGPDGAEVLLMRRHDSSGFVPGAWVFPGGRVDRADAEPELRERVLGLPDPDPPAAFWIAALREVFEETGVLFARDGAGAWSPDTSDPGVERDRRALMAGEETLAHVIARRDLCLDATGMVHIGHWVTPVVEPRRYDTHFFAAAPPDGLEARVDAREMTEASWLVPARALERFEHGELPMVFPTVKTLQSLAGFPTVDEALASLRRRTVERILPRLVRTGTGVAIVVD